ncbi:MAG: hypothetical protein K8S23_13060 [Candidatus Cloacimonetes bacterium]|nr:hypothetical protein [Candidatus Cloacimonadota bacterium]
MNKNKLLSAIENFSNLSVLVVGDVMLDVYEFCYTKYSKLIPSEKKGKRAYTSQESILSLGGAGNVAYNLSSLKVKTSLISVCGNDSNYFALKEIADNHNINHFFIRDSERPTIVKTRIYIDDEYHLRKDKENISKISDETSLSLLSEFYKQIKDTNIVILSDYNKGIFTKFNSQKIIQKCNELKIPVIVDFKPQNKKLFQNVTIMVPNFYKAKEVYNKFEINSDMKTSLKNISEILHCEQVIVTLHDNGICGYNKKEYFHIPVGCVCSIM